MDEATLNMLEFPRVREIVAGYASFSASHDLALALKPSPDPARVSQLLRQATEARRLLALRPDFGIGPAADVREQVQLAGKGKIVDTLVMLDIARTLSAARSARNSLQKVAEEIPGLWRLAETITPAPEVEAMVGRSIGPSGEVLDAASSRLQDLRDRLRRRRQELVEKLEEITHQRGADRYLQDVLVTEREGRLVIPVKSEMRHEVKGIVHDLSNTGATVFVEPWATVELGNEMREMTVAEKHEVERVLGELSAAIGARAGAIAHAVDALAELDLALARARYAQAVKGVEPNMLPFDDAPARPAIRLVDARHPLLKGKAVPVSVEIGASFNILVITGPNTGGKTVALKTAGLLALMAQAGIPIPAAEGTALPVFDEIYADIGDEQSIERTLSTFSWHMGNLVHILAGATGRSLVLLDELGTSTDPAEGSALARAILLEFRDRGTTAVATTHFSDLKVFAHSTPGLQNASLAFDPRTLAPTYQLTMGVPGGSNALNTATRLGLPARIIESARGLMSETSRKVETMLTDLGNEKLAVERLKLDLEREMEEAEAARRLYEEEYKKLEERDRTIIRQERDRLLEEGAELQRQLHQAASELRKSKSKEAMEKAEQALAHVREELKAERWQKKKAAQAALNAAPDANRPLAVGDRVRMFETSLEGVISALFDDGRQVEVQAGQTRVRLAADKVARFDAPEQKMPEGVAVSVRSGRGPVSWELDLRGRRADEVYPLLDAYLNDCFMARLLNVRIIHGTATGTVRQIVRDTLATHALVKSHRPGQRGEGGDGVTVVGL
jgi:DNA mismatch repair protein MutS2